jgi:hypothetical protein
MPGPNYLSITPSDSTVYSPALTWLWAGTMGTIAILGQYDSSPVTLLAIAAGEWIHLPYPIQKVMASNTSCTGIIGCATG